MPSTTPKLTAKSPARQILASKFRSGEITENEDLKDVWLSEPIFQHHKLNNFRKHYNNERKPARKTGMFKTAYQLFDLNIF